MTPGHDHVEAVGAQINRRDGLALPVRAHLPAFSREILQRPAGQ